jgi:hypothetical protein
MPGNLFQAECACGYEQGLSPGVDYSWTSHTMVYTKDGDDLATVLGDEANGLPEILDPVVRAPPFREGPFGPYHCPRCRRETLWLHHCGRWD